MEICEQNESNKPNIDIDIAYLTKKGFAHTWNNPWKAWIKNNILYSCFVAIYSVCVACFCCHKIG